MSDNGKQLDEISRAIGSLQASVSSLTASNASLQKEIGEMRREQQAVRQEIAQAKGGWKAMLLLGGGAATVGGFLVKFVHIPWVK